MKQRKNNIEKLRNERFDVLIIGGGMNGATTSGVKRVRPIGRTRFVKISALKRRPG